MRPLLPLPSRQLHLLLLLLLLLPHLLHPPRSQLRPRLLHLLLVALHPLSVPLLLHLLLPQVACLPPQVDRLSWVRSQTSPRTS